MKDDFYKKIDEAFAKIDWAKAARDYDLKLEIENKQKDRVLKFINSIPENQFQYWVNKFLVWEKKYEDFRYNHRHEQSHSKIFGAITDIVKEQGKNLNCNYTDFLYRAYKWKGYSFRLFVGQGSFWRITKGKKHIFQTS